MKYGVVKFCWDDSLDWTFTLVDVLMIIDNGKGRVIHLEEAKGILLKEKERILSKKETILDKLEGIDIHVKPVRNFTAALKRLLNSTEINLSKRSKMPMPVFDLFDWVDDSNAIEVDLRRNVSIVKRNVENNWIAFNQSFGRMLIKMKINGYEFA